MKYFKINKISLPNILFIVVILTAIFPAGAESLPDNSDIPHLRKQGTTMLF